MTTYFKRFESENTAAQLFATEDANMYLVTLLLAGQMVTLSARDVRDVIDILGQVDNCVSRRRARSRR